MRLRYRIHGVDCARDAATVEAAVRQLRDVDAAVVSIAGGTLTVSSDAGNVSRDALESVVRNLGYAIQPATDDRESTVPTQLRPGYRRALWLAAIINVGFGVVEMLGGFLARSQALKADALDFVGDGLITLLGVAAISWAAASRARVALMQGFFLAALGIGVLVQSGYRIFEQQQPEAGWMGGLGLAALAANVAAAALLLPHRSGDATVRAVWLFSRNDALANAAVILAAGLVAWTGTAWPDLVVALAIAGLFLHSASEIIRDARMALRTGAA